MTARCWHLDTAVSAPALMGGQDQRDDYIWGLAPCTLPVGANVDVLNRSSVKLAGLCITVSSGDLHLRLQQHGRSGSLPVVSLQEQTAPAGNDLGCWFKSSSLQVRFPVFS